MQLKQKTTEAATASTEIDSLWSQSISKKECHEYKTLERYDTAFYTLAKKIEERVVEGMECLFMSYLRQQYVEILQKHGIPAPSSSSSSSTNFIATQVLQKLQGRYVSRVSQVSMVLLPVLCVAV